MTFPPLHVLIMDEQVERVDLMTAMASMRAACGTGLALHLRLRATADARAYELASGVAAGAAEQGGWCVVNRRIDMALAVGAQAVQLGFGSLPFSVARDLLPAGVRLGASVHDCAAAELRAREGYDYLVLGTMYPTRTHPDVAIGGPQLLGWCSHVTQNVPIVAIGGIDRERVAEVIAAGADGIAVNRAIWGASDPVAAALALLETVRGARGEPESEACGGVGIGGVEIEKCMGEAE